METVYILVRLDYTGLHISQNSVYFIKERIINFTSINNKYFVSLIICKNWTLVNEMHQKNKMDCMYMDSMWYCNKGNIVKS